VWGVWGVWEVARTFVFASLLTPNSQLPTPFQSLKPKV
jgi:hypothetical protein